MNLVAKKEVNKSSKKWKNINILNVRLVGLSVCLPYLFIIHPGKSWRPWRAVVWFHHLLKTGSSKEDGENLGTSQQKRRLQNFVGVLCNVQAESEMSVISSDGVTWVLAGLWVALVKISLGSRKTPPFLVIYWRTRALKGWKGDF